MKALQAYARTARRISCQATPGHPGQQRHRRERRVSYSSLHGPAIHADGVMTPDKIQFATGNQVRRAAREAGAGGVRER